MAKSLEAECNYWKGKYKLLHEMMLSLAENPYLDPSVMEKKMKELLDEE